MTTDSEKGWIYIMSNPAMPGLLKVGFTMKHPSQRAQELNGTGVPLPFKVEWKKLVTSPKALESRIHRDLEQYRVKKREFFRCDLLLVIAVAERHIGTSSARMDKPIAGTRFATAPKDEIVSTVERNGEFYAIGCEPEFEHTNAEPPKSREYCQFHTAVADGALAGHSKTASLFSGDSDTSKGCSYPERPRTSFGDRLMFISLAGVGYFLIKLIALWPNL